MNMTVSAFAEDLTEEMEDLTIYSQSSNTPLVNLDYIDDTSEQKNANKLITDDLTEEIINLKIEFFSKSFSIYNKLNIEKTLLQDEVAKSLLIQLAELCVDIKDYSILETSDQEIQFYKELHNGYGSLIIDEFGGITYLVMRQKGYGYICDYYRNEEINHVKTGVVKNFSLL